MASASFRSALSVALASSPALRPRLAMASTRSARLALRLFAVSMTPARQSPSAPSPRAHRNRSLVSALLLRLARSLMKGQMGIFRAASPRMTAAVGSAAAALRRRAAPRESPATALAAATSTESASSFSLASSHARAKASSPTARAVSSLACKRAMAAAMRPCATSVRAASGVASSRRSRDTPEQRRSSRAKIHFTCTLPSSESVLSEASANGVDVFTTSTAAASNSVEPDGLLTFTSTTSPLRARASSSSTTRDIRFTG